MTETQLLELKKKIEEARQTTSELKGHQGALLKQLKDDWKCSDVKEAEKLIEKMDKEILALNKSIEEKLKELEEKYNA